MQKYNLEFILHIYAGSIQALKSSLSEFGENLELVDCQDAVTGNKSHKINVITEDPTAIFDICAEFGRIKSAKIDEISE